MLFNGWKSFMKITTAFITAAQIHRNLSSRAEKADLLTVPRSSIVYFFLPQICCFDLNLF